MFLCLLGESWRFSFYRLEKISGCCSVTQSCLTLWPHGVQHARLPFTIPFTISQNLLKLISIELRKSSNHPVLSCPLLLLSSIFPNIRVFCSELAHRIRWPKYWCNSFSISPSNEYSVPISFRIDWFDLLAVQGTLKSLLLHHSSKASILQHSASFMVQHSHWCMTTEKIALTIWTFVGKAMPLLFYVLSRFVVAFLPRSKHLLILWLQSLSTVIL